MAEEAKSAGDVAYRAKNFDEAISKYTSAMELNAEATNDWLLKIYSNRCAVYTANQNYPSALKDANKCISLDATWVKGYVRKGDVCFRLHKFDESIDAYEKAIVLAPADAAVYTTKKNASAKALQEESRKSITIVQANGRLGEVQSSCIKYILGCFIVYSLPLRWIPLLGSYVPPALSYYAYIAFAILTILKSIIECYNTLGWPTLSVKYFARIAHIDGSQLYLGILLLGSRPYLLAMLPILLQIAVQNADLFIPSIIQQIPQIKALVGSRVAQAVPILDQIEQGLRTPQAVTLLKEEVSKLGCSFEVMQGFFVLIELVLPTRNFIMCYIWWQYLLTRYTSDSSGKMKQAFSLLDDQLSGFFQHRYCPAFVGKFYAVIRNFGKNQAEKKQRNGSQEESGSTGGFLSGLKNAASSCTVQ